MTREQIEELRLHKEWSREEKQALLAAAERALELEDAIRECLREHAERGYKPDHMGGLRAAIEREGR